MRSLAALSVSCLLLACRPEQGRVPAMARPGWPALLHGPGPVAVSEIVATPGGAVAIGAARLGVAVGEHQLTEKPCAFLTALDRRGTPAWVRVLESTAAIQIDAAVRHPNGELLFAGFFAGAVRSGRRQLASAGGLDCMAGRLDRAGRLIWWERFGGGGSDVCRGLALTPERLFLVGATEAEHAQGHADVLVMAVDAETGALVRASTWGSPGHDELRSAAPTAAGGLMVAGTFGGRLEGSTTLDLGPHALLRSEAEADGFLAELSPDGEPAWAVAFSGPAVDVAEHVSPLRDGWLVCGTAGENAAEGEPQGFVSHLDAAGRQRWVWSMPGVRSCRAAIGFPDGDAVMVGEYRGELALGETRWATLGGDTGLVTLVLGPDGQTRSGYACDGPGPDLGLALSAAGERVFVGGAVTSPSGCAPWATGALGLVLPLVRIGSELRPGLPATPPTNPAGG